MARKVIGPTGSRRRRWLFLCTAVAAIAAAVLIIPSAFAVHNLGVFELDTGPHTLGGQTYTGANATSETTDDWDRVCYKVMQDSQCGSTTNASAKARAWATDRTIGSTGSVFTADPNASLFTGGGSKDPQDTNQWAWKDGAGGLPDKDNLQHAFAARYDVNSANCTGTETSCDVLYFGSDRFDNSGDAQQGFWFLQNATATQYNNNGTQTVCPQKIGGATGFCDPNTGAAVVHRDGDMLVISDFSNGGTNSTITIYEWCTGSASSTGTCAGQPLGLHFLAGSNTASAQCGIGSTDDPFCGIVNLTNGTPAPWPYTDKSGNHSYLAGELFEAGIDLTNLGLANECFSSVLSETRSSTSTTATLKDFVLAQFSPCHATLTTTQSTSAAVAPGTPVNDTATIVGNQATKYPTGTVTFYLCGPTSGLTSCTSTDTTKKLVGTGALAADNTTSATSNATSPNVNCASTATTGCSTTTGTSPLAPGDYCFLATWPGDTNYTVPLSEGGAGSG